MEHSTTERKTASLLRPDVAPSNRGGLILIGPDGSRVHVPDSEVEVLIEEMESVRRRQLRAECNAICSPLRFPGVA